MASVRKEILRSWVHEAASLRGLASLLGVPAPVQLRALLDRLRAVESVSVGRDVVTPDGFPLGGRVDFTLRSDGSCVFSGHMRATGGTSYRFGLQAWVATGKGPVLAAQKVGRVFGTDTPGDRQRDWSEAGTNAGIPLHWHSLRQGRGVGLRLDAEMSGVLGSVHDVVAFAVKGLALGAALGPAGWLLLIGAELGDLDAQLASPDILAGILVGGATLLIVGPFGLVPALVAGAATVALADVRHRPMTGPERDYADRVFKGTIDYDKVVLTNLSHDDGRKFTIPSIGKSILVNLDDAFDDPVHYKETPDSDYPEPGAVFIHELTHAWQIANNSFLGVICGMDSNYDYYDERGRSGDTAWPQRSFGTFNNEQQAHIVDDWYGMHLVRAPDGSFQFDAQGLPMTDFDGFASIQDPAYRFIRDHIRARVP